MALSAKWSAAKYINRAHTKNLEKLYMHCYAIEKAENIKTYLRL